MKADTRQIQEDLVKNMKQWQKIEDASIASTGQIIEKTENPLIRLVAEIIQRDSQMHHRVQEFIADSIEHKAVSLTVDELRQAWDLIEHHINIEQQTMSLARDMVSCTQGQQGMVVQDYLVNYLLQDEQKHTDMLSRLNDIKKGMYQAT